MIWSYTEPKATRAEKGTLRSLLYAMNAPLSYAHEYILGESGLSHLIVILKTKREHQKIEGMKHKRDEPVELMYMEFIIPCSSEDFKVNIVLDAKVAPVLTCMACAQALAEKMMGA